MPKVSHKIRAALLFFHYNSRSWQPSSYVPKPAAPTPDNATNKTSSKARTAWNFAHHNWGRAITALAIANVYIGIVLYARKWGGDRDLAAWLAAVTGFIGVLLVAEVTLTGLSAHVRRKASAPDAEAELVRGGDKLDMNASSSVSKGGDAKERGGLADERGGLIEPGGA